MQLSSLVLPVQNSQNCRPNSAREQCTAIAMRTGSPFYDSGSVIQYKSSLHFMRKNPRRKPLQMEDIWELPPGDKVGRVSETFEGIWDKELNNPQGPSLVCVLPKPCLHCSPDLCWFKKQDFHTSKVLSRFTSPFSGSAIALRRTKSAAKLPHASPQERSTGQLLSARLSTGTVRCSPAFNAWLPDPNLNKQGNDL